MRSCHFLLGARKVRTNKNKQKGWCYVQAVQRSKENREEGGDTYREDHVWENSIRA